MASWDDSFLSEVEDFLTSCEPLNGTDSYESATTDPSSSSTADSGDSAPDVQTTAGDKAKPTKPVRVRRKARFKRQLDDRTRHKVYRERQRTEREELETEVEELQSKLVTERAKMLSLSAWSMLSKRQLLARLSAETQRKRLRSVVSMQSVLIQGYGALIREQIPNGGGLVQEDDGGGFFEPNTSPLDAFDSEFFRSYTKQLKDMYAQTGGMFSGREVGTAGRSPSDSWRKCRETGFLFRSQQSVLFDFAKTCELLWHVADVPHRHESRQRFNEVEDPENTVALKFRVTNQQVQGGTASLLHRCIVRRYQDHNRMVLVWWCFVEGEGIFAGMHADVVGWGLIVPSAGPSSRRTLLQNCMRHMPMHINATVACQARVEEFTRLALEERAYDAFETIHSLRTLLRSEP